MKRAPLLLLLNSLILTVACCSTSRSRASDPPTDHAATVVAAGQEVLAVVKALEPKLYTDTLEDGRVLLSDVYIFSITEPSDLVGITVSAYYQGNPVVGNRRLQVGDLVRFTLPPEVQRSGIYLLDLKNLRFAELP